MDNRAPLISSSHKTIDHVSLSRDLPLEKMENGRVAAAVVDDEMVMLMENLPRTIFLLMLRKLGLLRVTLWLRRDHCFSTLLDEKPLKKLFLSNNTRGQTISLYTDGRPTGNPILPYSVLCGLHRLGDCGLKKRVGYGFLLRLPWLI